MVTNTNPLNAHLDGHLCILNMLYPLQHYGTIPMLLQQFYLIPGMPRSGKYSFLPRHTCKKNIIFDLLVVHLFKLAAEYRITEACLVTNTRSKGDVCIVEVGRSPSKGPCVESDDEHFIAVVLGAIEKLGTVSPFVLVLRAQQVRYRYGDFVILGPVKLVPPMPIAVRLRNLFDTATRRRAQNIRDPDLACYLGNPGLFVVMKDRLNSNRRDEDGRFKFLAKELDSEIAVCGRAEHAGDHLL